jgi:hypothetical protein
LAVTATIGVRAPLQDQRAENALLAHQWHDQGSAVPGGEVDVAQWRAEPLGQVGQLHWCALYSRLAHRGLVLGDAQLADRAQQRFVPAECLNQAEPSAHPEPS